MPNYDPTTFGKRLKAELDARGWDVRTFQDKLKRATGGARGTSYSAVWTYVNGCGPADPRRSVVEAMARLLGVLPDYLWFGGPRTEVEAAAQREVEASEGAELYER